MMRYGIQLAMPRLIACHPIFPWPTFTVNIIGSFIIGLLAPLSARLNLSDDMRLLLMTGLCGGFTTFSTFSADNLNLLRQGSILACIVYTLLSVTLGVAACYGGYYIMCKS